MNSSVQSFASIHNTVKTTITIEQSEEVMATLSPIVNQIVEKFHPSRSFCLAHRRQDTHKDSDIGLLVVMGTTPKNAAQEVEILRTLNYEGNLDLIVRTPETRQERLKLGDSFRRDIVAEGIVLYAQSDN
ncbi:MAG: hypothetical protein R2911_34695 [Caldilineaceae bacterium]